MNEIMAITLGPTIGIGCAVAFTVFLVAGLVKADRDQRRKFEAEGTRWCRAYTQIIPGLRMILRNKFILMLGIITLLIMFGSLLAQLIRRQQ